MHKEFGERDGSAVVPRHRNRTLMTRHEGACQSADQTDQTDARVGRHGKPDPAAKDQHAGCCQATGCNSDQNEP
jgi:hypothetical protein